MPSSDDILWFKLQFGTRIAKAVKGTPFDLDMVTAIACQETGYIWSVLRKKGLSTQRIVELCVGDTLDADKGRSAFPKTYQELIAKPNGQQMFAIAHQALVDMAAYIPGYKAVAKQSKKFCHGYGPFQYDLQYFEGNPDFFLQKKFADFDVCAGLCVDELKRKQIRVGLAGRTQLSDMEMAKVAIAYNTGGYKPERGLQQGHRSDDGRYYGQGFYDYLLKSRTVVLPVEAPPGQAIMPTPTAVTATGDWYEVDTRVSLLNLRDAPDGNRINGLPDGQVVRAIGSAPSNGFLEIETTLAGALLRGFVSTDFLKKRSGGAVAEALIASPPPPPAPSGLTAVYMPRKAGVITRRVDKANAHSLNEPGAPGRKGSNPQALCDELGAIISWLGVDKAAHLRYQPRDGLTFCNIYAHDYCYLAGVYLPRVWWTPGAVLAIGQGNTVEPKYGATIEEFRANNLFRWLRDFGGYFGWRQTGMLDKLQQHANQGGVALIVARRKEEGRSGHIVAVVPETDEHSAARDTAGQVVGPLQSQAGATNARYLDRANWWNDDKFAEHAFWIHA